VSLETAKREKQHIQELVEKEGVELQDLFNMDGTGLFYGQAPVFCLGSVSLI
jgi:hypothetical protein